MPIYYKGQSISANVLKQPEIEGSIDITENGSYDVTQYTSANVNVPQTLFRQLAQGTLTEITADDLRGVTRIKNDFYNVGGNTEGINQISLTIPNTVVTIGSKAFFGSVSSLTFESGSICSTIMADAFRYLSATYLRIPDSVTTIGGYCFYASNMWNSTVIIGSGVTDIGNYAFYNLKSTKIIVKPATPPLLGTALLQSTVPLIYVPRTSINAYKTATNWTANACQMYPLVSTVSDLSNVDTTTYTRACVEGNEEYTEYTYDGSRWNIVT